MKAKTRKKIQLGLVVAALGCLRALNEENYLSSNGYHYVTLETLNI